MIRTEDHITLAHMQELMDLFEKAGGEFDREQFKDVLFKVRGIGLGTASSPT